MNIYQKLEVLQQEFKAPKKEYNKHGNFSYRSIEKMLKDLKPMLKKHKALLYFEDKLENCAETPHIVATAVLINLDKPDEVIRVSAGAQEAAIQKGMQAAQISGSTSSYARKYALSALLLVDDTDEIDKKEGDQTDWESEIASAKDTQGLVRIFTRMNSDQKKSYTEMLGVRKKELLDADS